MQLWLLSGTIPTTEPMPWPGSGRCEQAASWWAVLWSRRDWRDLERQQSWANSTTAATAPTVYSPVYVSNVTLGTLGGGPDNVDLLKDVPPQSSHCSDSLPSFNIWCDQHINIFNKQKSLQMCLQKSWCCWCQRYFMLKLFLFF